jgi:pimeloyl-ACP methyl ester carboxylesterase
MFVATPPQVRVDCFNGFGTMDLRAPLADVDLPAVVLVGRRDRLTPPRLGRAVAAAIPGARFEVLPGAGHMLPLERATVLTTTILGELRAGAAAEGARGA